MLAAGNQYALTINGRIRSIQKRGKEVACDKLIKYIHREWKIGGEGKKSILVIDSGKKSLLNLGQVIYTHCHKTGHLRKDYPDVVCKYPGCGKMGHSTKKC